MPWTRVQIGKASVFCDKKRQNIEVISDTFGDFEWAVLMTEVEKLNSLFFEIMKVSVEEKNLEYFIDSVDKKIYLSGFMEHQFVHEMPVSAIVFFTETVKIYVGEFCIEIAKMQLSKKCQSTQFFENPKRPASSVGETSLTHKKYRENKEVADSSSIEYGIFTQSDIGSRSIISNEAITTETHFRSPIHREEEDEMESRVSVVSGSYENNEELRLEVTPVPLRKMNKKHKGQSKMDQTLNRKNKIIMIKQKMTELTKKKFLKNPKEIMVCTQHLKMGKNVDTSDAVVKQICDEMGDSPIMRIQDPIVVTEVNGEFNVISGNRRVMAYKCKNVEKICVSQIPSEAQSDFRLHKFIEGMKTEETRVSQIIELCRLLMEHLELSPQELRSWSTKEIAKVFHDHFKPRTQQRTVFEICFHENLVDAVLVAHENGLKFGAELCRDVLRRYHHNPNKVLELMNNPDLWKNDGILRTEINKVESSLFHELKKRKIDEIVCKELCDLFENDEDFASFMTSADLRSVSETKQKEGVIRRFNIYKRKIFENPSTEHNEHTIKVEKNPDSFDILLTSDELMKETVWREKSSVIILLLGVSNSSNHTVTIPDILGKEDENGQLTNHVSLSILAKYDGIEVEETQMTSFLNSLGIINKTVFKLADLKPFSRARPIVFVDMSCLISDILVKEVLASESTIIVRNTSDQRKLHRILNSKNTSQVQNISDDDGNS